MGRKWVAAKYALPWVYSLLLFIVASETASNEHGGRVDSIRNETRKVPCPSGWVLSLNKSRCIRYVENWYSWDMSEKHCQGYGGHLAAVASHEELKVFQKLSSSKIGRSCWIGGKLVNSTSSLRWKWSDSSVAWNHSMFPNLASCRNSSCHVHNLAEKCALLTNGSESVVGERCNASHSFICMIDTEEKCSHMHCHREYLIILATVSGLILCTTFGVVIWLLVFKRSKKRRKSRKLSNPASSALVPPSWKLFTGEELKCMTKNFSEANLLLGDAKTGGTYTGLLPDGTKVAVKRLKRSSFQRKKEFYSEIRRVAKLHHPNLVVVKGCCYDHGDRYIVYEFIANGPLDRWLHHVPRGGRSLDWPMRMKIVTTLAQGIAFLHDKVKPQVVHRDIRASNVLLDEDFQAHLMGVGLSKFIPWEVTQERTVMAGGTYGYLAPEYVYRNESTTKSDVYSFGVLLLEIVTGRRPAQAVNSSVGWQSIFEWATPLVQAHHYLELLDPLITSEKPEASVVHKVVDLVYACTQNVPSMRPRMSHVVHQLQQLQPPVVE